ncbi:copper chaperone PCu(A)C [Variovorax terrae]|uniref:Copper chaperone PCu(A)C n=1 Tax=Variovorax terrae TaxID=2923278 RepID=A0A9X1VUA6_9BURK|nr:copper chaperone PCu(A)C [Variovorax terrae]MCJ0763976.1 copper chaperone PCu(A)C [Variovorax terrae]
MKFPRLCLALALLGAAAVADAHEYYLPGLTFVHPWAEPTAPGATSAPVYFTVEAVSKGDKLVKVVTPLAEKVEFRDAGPASKPPLKSLSIQPGGDTEFTEGKRHLLLQGLKMPLQWGRSYEMTLMFEKGGPLQVMVSVGAH